MPGVPQGDEGGKMIGLTDDETEELKRIGSRYPREFNAALFRRYHFLTLKVLEGLDKELKK